jgi:hypothetical protein
MTDATARPPAADETSPTVNWGGEMFTGPSPAWQTSWSDWRPHPEPAEELPYAIRNAAHRHPLKKRGSRSVA